MTAIEAENMDNIRLRKSIEFLAHCREKENAARRALAEAIEDTKCAKNKYETLFVECENLAVDRRKRGLIEKTFEHNYL